MTLLTAYIHFGFFLVWWGKKGSIGALLICYCVVTNYFKVCCQGRRPWQWPHFNERACCVCAYTTIVSVFFLSKSNVVNKSQCLGLCVRSREHKWVFVLDEEVDICCVWVLAFFLTYFLLCCCTQRRHVSLRLCVFVYVYCTALDCYRHSALRPLLSEARSFYSPLRAVWLKLEEWHLSKQDWWKVKPHLWRAT